MNKETAVYAIQTFMSFLNIAKITQSQNVTNITSFREQSLSLMEEVSTGRLDALTAISQLNGLIEQLNQHLKAPYPLLMMESSESLVKGEIVAFEHYLNQELKANHLTLQQEAPLFNDSLLLWEKVGVSLTAKEGVNEFAALVEKLNRFLPHEEQYPLPDKNQFYS